MWLFKSIIKLLSYIIPLLLWLEVITTTKLLWLEQQFYILIHYVHLFVCLTRVLGGGGGRGRWSNGRPVSVCDEGWTTMISVYKPSPQSIVAVRRVGMTVGSHPSPTTPEADIKTFPPPPPLPQEPAVI